MSSNSAKSYHHGNLREALLSAAREVLEREGVGALSLRGLARKVGVSVMAPYHHFPDRKALLVAVAISGFEALQQSKLAVTSQSATATETLIQGSRNYIGFVINNPNLFRLMQSPELTDRKQYPDLHRAATEPAKTLIRSIEALSRENGYSSLDVNSCAKTLWGLAHGIAILALDGEISGEEAMVLGANGAAAVISGWRRDS